jgi:L-arabinonolactonase
MGCDASGQQNSMERFPMNLFPEVTRVLDPDNYLGEAPIWSAEEQALYWINCEQPPELHRWTPTTGAHKVWPMPNRVGGVAIAGDGRLALVLADGIYHFEPASGNLSMRCRSPLPAHVKLHETQCDRQGRLWVGSFDHHFSAKNGDAAGGSFFRLSGEELIPEVPGIHVANGLAFSPDGRTLYAADAPTRLVEAFDLDPATGHLSNRRPFLNLQDGEGYPDGATIDVEGGYWLACVGAGALRRYRPDGSLDRVVSLPFSNPTKPAFGGPDLDVLFVTSTKMKFAPEGIVANGGLFWLKPGVQGIQEPLFAG